MSETEIYEAFKPEYLTIIYQTTLYYDLGLDGWELYDILERLNIEGTNWSRDDFTVNAYKQYDEDGNSETLSILQIESKDRDYKDFVTLAKMWHVAEQ